MIESVVTNLWMIWIVQWYCHTLHLPPLNEKYFPCFQWTFPFFILQILFIQFFENLHKLHHIVWMLRRCQCSKFLYEIECINVFNVVVLYRIPGCYYKVCKAIRYRGIVSEKNRFLGRVTVLTHLSTTRIKVYHCSVFQIFDLN